MKVRAPLTPGTLSPWRAVSAGIARPEYVGKKRPKEWRGSHVQTPETIEKIVWHNPVQFFAQSGRLILDDLPEDRDLAATFEGNTLLRGER